MDKYRQHATVQNKYMVPEELIECFKANYIAGDEKSLENVFLGAREMGYHALETIALLMEMLGLGLGEAKMIVDSSPVFGYGVGHGYE